MRDLMAQPTRNSTAKRKLSAFEGRTALDLALAGSSDSGGWGKSFKDPASCVKLSSN